MGRNRLGVFIDFDGVITPKPVNMQFAAFLKIEKDIQEIEQSYAQGKIDNHSFNRDFIPKFRNAKFSQSYADAHFEYIALSELAEEFIQISRPNLHIVTSSPSYFIHPFAIRHGISEDNIICSEYSFDKEGLIHKCIRPVSSDEKAKFVSSKIKDFDLTIAIGDSPEQDGRFMSMCDIKILINNNRPGYFSAPDLSQMISSISKINTLMENDSVPDRFMFGLNRLLQNSYTDNNVFIITPFRRDIRFQTAVDAIKQRLEDNHFKGWTADDLQIAKSDSLWDNVMNYMHVCKYGISLLTPREILKDNSIQIDGETLNHNVLIETGYMLGLGKTMLLLKDRKVVMPTDWAGFLWREFDLTYPVDDIHHAMDNWLQTLKN